jgi:hypothetical protein
MDALWCPPLESGIQNPVDGDAVRRLCHNIAAVSVSEADWLQLAAEIRGTNTTP